VNISLQGNARFDDISIPYSDRTTPYNLTALLVTETDCPTRTTLVSADPCEDEQEYNQDAGNIAEHYIGLNAGIAGGSGDFSTRPWFQLSLPQDVL